MRRANGVRLTKRLVAHRPIAPEESERGPLDGAPVWLAAPCPRLRAGYACECGYGFEFRPGWPDDWSLARVVPIDGHEPTRYQEEDWVLSDMHGWASSVDDTALSKQIEGLEIGTVVERHGLGIAPLFESLHPQTEHEPAWMLDVSDPF